MKTRVVVWKNLSAEEKRELLRRPVPVENLDFQGKVREIIEKVRKEKDQALFSLTKKYDGAVLDSIQVSDAEIFAATQQIDARTLSALKEAIRRITLFHQAQLPKSIQLETSPGVRCERRFLPVDRIGLYVPAGTAPLPSTLLMLGIPARIAGCKNRILTTPCRKDGAVDPTTLVAADLLEIRQIYKVGGAQAIAAMAYGTETIPKVDKIFGPGNSWVTEAKIQVSKDPFGAACDMPAGPSEVMVIADSSAEPAFVAADLLSQAEHGKDSQVILISDSADFIARVEFELNYQLESLPRKEIAEAALSKSLIIEVSLLSEAVSICNEYAPEHLILQIEGARAFSDKIRNAGSIFLGPWTPEALGDYASGTNHVLPTYGFARCYGGLGTESFMKSMTLQEVSLEGLKALGPTVEELARVEMLDAHKKAVSIRLNRGAL